MVTYEIGKQGLETCRRLFEKVLDRVQLPFPNKKMQIFSDGNDDYKSTLPEYYAETCVDYGQIIKIRESGKVVDKIKRVIFGNPSIDEIETTDIENMNGIFRERIGRLVRKTKCYSKKKSRLENAVELYQFYWNFMDKLPKNGTPAMVESLTNHQWNWEDFFNFQLSILN
jgi:hypothetical protein